HRPRPRRLARPHRGRRPHRSCRSAEQPVALEVKRRPLLLVAGAVLLGGGALARGGGRRLPVQGTRRFLTAPVEGGEGPPAALDAFQKLLRHYAGYLGEQAPALREGLELMERGDLPGARAAFERMVREQPDSEFVPVAHALVARIHWSWGEPMEAVRAFGRM